MRQEIEHFRELVDASINGMLSGLGDIDVAMRYSALAPGKRIRSFLFLMTAQIFKIKEQEIIDIAASIELVHTYSLVHDDLPAMDDATYRRGQLTCHKKFDETTAILVGDALLTIAFKVISNNKSLLAKTKCQLITALADAVGHCGMIKGQMQDMQAMHRSLTLEHVEELQDLKTGKLFAFCCQAAAIIANASDSQRAALDVYTKKLGLVFQITDDILDYEGDIKDVGKDLKQDHVKGKATFVSLLGMAKSKKLLQDLVAEAKAALSVFNEQAISLVELVDFVASRKN